MMTWPTVPASRCARQLGGDSRLMGGWTLRSWCGVGGGGCSSGLRVGPGGGSSNLSGLANRPSRHREGSSDRLPAASVRHRPQAFRSRYRSHMAARQLDPRGATVEFVDQRFPLNLPVDDALPDHRAEPSFLAAGRALLPRGQGNSAPTPISTEPEMIATLATLFRSGDSISPAATITVPAKTT